jgi:hypothetical protein
MKGEEMSEPEDDGEMPEDSSELIDLYHNRHVIDSKKTGKAKELPFVQY